MDRDWKDNIQQKKSLSNKDNWGYIEQHQLLNNFIQEIEITALKKSQWYTKSEMWLILALRKSRKSELIRIS